MRAGQLRERVRFEARAVSESKYVKGSGVWGIVAGDRPARIAPLRGSEEIVAGRLSGVSGFEIWVRFESALDAATTSWRIVDERNDDIYNIKHKANPDRRRRWLIFTCDTGASETGD